MVAELGSPPTAAAALRVLHNAFVLRLTDVLTPEEVTDLRATLGDAPFKDGRLTAGVTARKVKSNLQADNADAEVRRVAGIVRAAFERSDVFRLYARPARWSNVIFSRYGVGNEYGLHVDDPLMTGEDGRRFRTDLSFTLFLSDPDTYDGGELLVEGRQGSRQVKLPAGGVVVYPSGNLHRVAPVTAGERLACVGWLQSFIRSDEQRELLFDLGRVRSTLAESDAGLLVDKTVSNLMRMWADT